MKGKDDFESLENLRSKVWLEEYSLWCVKHVS